MGKGRRSAQVFPVPAPSQAFLPLTSCHITLPSAPSFRRTALCPPASLPNVSKEPKRPCPQEPMHPFPDQTAWAPGTLELSASEVSSSISACLRPGAIL